MRVTLLPLVVLLSLAAAPAQVFPMNVKGGNAKGGDPVEACRALRALVVPASAIGLPTSGATIQSARIIVGTFAGKRYQYCRLRGSIAPHDAAAEMIRFQINLPTHWNRRAVHYGGGGFNGYLKQSDGVLEPTLADKSQPTPLARGYSTYGSDSGHHHHYLLLPDEFNVVRTNISKNAEVRANFIGDALKKMHDVAMVVIQRRYGALPEHTFFLGGSTGGREALRVVQLYPLDYDGVLSGFSAWNQIQLDLKFDQISEALYRKGGWLSRSQTRLLYRSTLAACDSLDGLRDGLISNPSACHFNPVTLLCPGGGRGRHCLSERQVETVEAFAQPQRTDFPFANGVMGIPGLNVLAGTDLTGELGWLHHPFQPPIYLLNNFYLVVANSLLTRYITNERHFPVLSFNTATGSGYAAELVHQSQLNDSSIAAIQPFRDHGGKLILVHGTADALIPTGATVQYYQRLQREFTPAELDSFTRLYLIPGFGHDKGVFDAGFDALGALDAWVSAGHAPNHLTTVDNHREHDRTRPLCPWPSWPQYRGTGSRGNATSFTCASGMDTGMAPGS